MRVCSWSARGPVAVALGAVAGGRVWVGGVWGTWSARSLVAVERGRWQLWLESGHGSVGICRFSGSSLGGVEVSVAFAGAWRGIREGSVRGGRGVRWLLRQGGGWGRGLGRWGCRSEVVAGGVEVCGGVRCAGGRVWGGVGDWGGVGWQLRWGRWLGLGFGSVGLPFRGLLGWGRGLGGIRRVGVGFGVGGVSVIGEELGGSCAGGGGWGWGMGGRWGCCSGVCCSGGVEVSVAFAEAWRRVWGMRACSWWARGSAAVALGEAAGGGGWVGEGCRSGGCWWVGSRFWRRPLGLAWDSGLRGVSVVGEELGGCCDGGSGWGLGLRGCRWLGRSWVAVVMGAVAGDWGMGRWGFSWRGIGGLGESVAGELGFAGWGALGGGAVQGVVVGWGSVGGVAAKGVGVVERGRFGGGPTEPELRFSMDIALAP